MNIEVNQCGRELDGGPGRIISTWTIPFYLLEMHPHLSLLPAPQFLLMLWGSLFPASACMRLYNLYGQPRMWVDEPILQAGPSGGSHVLSLTIR